MPSTSAFLTPLFATIAAGAGLYVAFLALLCVPSIQDHVIYLHKVTLTWFQNVNVPEQWGFLRNQVTPFHLNTSDHETLHAWHILPLETYRLHETELREQPTGLCSSIQDSYGFKLLKDDPEARLILYFHGAAGTLGSGWRPQSYRALSAAAPNVHVLAIDYRGFGTSTGWPSEAGMLTDALTLANFAMNEASISPDRIVLFAQSLGTAVTVSLSEYLARQTPPVLFAGTVLVAPFADAALLTETYRIAGTIPLLSPIARIPGALSIFHLFLRSKWPSKTKLASLIHRCEGLSKSDSAEGRRLYYDITLIHAEDDYDIPWIHSDILFHHAVNAAQAAVFQNEDHTETPHTVMSFEELEAEKAMRKVPLGAGGWQMEWRSNAGVIREDIVKFGLHDRIMSYPVVSLAVARIFARKDGR